MTHGCSSCTANAMYMAGQEMEKVLERDNVTIRRHLAKVGKCQFASSRLVPATCEIEACF